MTKLPGNYIAGFVDGEGCFALNAGPRKDKPNVFNVTAAFIIKLRADDSAILRSICKTIGVGTIEPVRSYRNEKKATTYRVTKISDLLIVVTFFERFPLRAKKLKDFRVWAAAIRYLTEIQARPSVPTGIKHGHSRWTEFDRARIQAFAKDLKAGRCYEEDFLLPADWIVSAISMSPSGERTLYSKSDLPRLRLSAS